MDRPDSVPPDDLQRRDKRISPAPLDARAAPPKKRRTGKPADETGAERERPPAPDKKLSLWPLDFEEAVEAILQVPPMPKDKEKAPPKGRRSGLPPSPESDGG